MAGQQHAAIIEDHAIRLGRQAIARIEQPGLVIGQPAHTDHGQVAGGGGYGPSVGNCIRHNHRIACGDKLLAVGHAKCGHGIAREARKQHCVVRRDRVTVHHKGAVSADLQGGAAKQGGVVGDIARAGNIKATSEGFYAVIIDKAGGGEGKVALGLQIGVIGDHARAGDLQAAVGEHIAIKAKACIGVDDDTKLGAKGAVMDKAGGGAEGGGAVIGPERAVVNQVVSAEADIKARGDFGGCGIGQAGGMGACAARDLDHATRADSGGVDNCAVSQQAVGKTTRQEIVIGDIATGRDCQGAIEGLNFPCVGDVGAGKAYIIDGLNSALVGKILCGG